MNEIQYKNWATMSDRALSEQIGEFVRKHRLDQNKTQEELSHSAGISRSTLGQLEKGETVTLATLIQVIRVLDQLQVMDAFVFQEKISPLTLAKIEQGKRQRASSKNSGDGENSTW
jgi:DNA-binding XRE family transcriptional regulator